VIFYVLKHGLIGSTMKGIVIFERKEWVASSLTRVVTKTQYHNGYGAKQTFSIALIIFSVVNSKKREK